MNGDAWRQLTRSKNFFALCIFLYICETRVWKWIKDFKYMRVYTFNVFMGSWLIHSRPLSPRLLIFPKHFPKTKKSPHYYSRPDVINWVHLWLDSSSLAVFQLQTWLKPRGPWVSGTSQINPLKTVSPQPPTEPPAQAAPAALQDHRQQRFTQPRRQHDSAPTNPSPASSASDGSTTGRPRMTRPLVGWGVLPTLHRDSRGRCSLRQCDSLSAASSETLLHKRARGSQTAPVFHSSRH